MPSRGAGPAAHSRGLTPALAPRPWVGAPCRFMRLLVERVCDQMSNTDRMLFKAWAFSSRIRS